MSDIMIRAVTFDLWHTVLEEPMENFSDFLRKNRAEAMEQVFAARGIPQSLEDLERAYDVQGKRLWDIWNRGADIDQEAQIGIVLSELGIRPDDWLLYRPCLSTERASSSAV
jgi:FMN phosphatase YigB (HAD superfamily)